MKKAIQLDDFDLNINPVRDSNGLIVSGLTVGDITVQNQALLLMLHQGELKEQPLIGVGISDMLLDDDPLAWRMKIREQLELDGQTVNDIKIDLSGITIDANY